MVPRNRPLIQGINIVFFQMHFHDLKFWQAIYLISVNSNGGSSNGGNGNLYQQLIDSSDLVKELDDIEAISQQISQHAEVLYQNWKTNSGPRGSNSQPSTPTSPTKVSSTSTTYGAGVGFPKRSILENGVENGCNGPESQRSSSPSQKVSPLSSPTSTLTSPSFINKSMPKGDPKIDLMPPPEVNGNLKDLVNSFVSTDRAKQAARQTISSTITNQMNKRNNFRSPSPTSTSTTSSPFSSRGVSPLRSPMLVNPAPPERRLMDAFPTNASIMNSVHTKMPPMFSNEEQQNINKRMSLPPLQIQPQPQTWSESVGSNLIRIPVHHLPNSTPSNSSEDSLRSPSILMSSPPATNTSLPPSFRGVGVTAGKTTSFSNLHAAHVETMKKRFEEAKERINAMQQRAIQAGQTPCPFPNFIANPLSASESFGDEIDFFSRIRSRPQRPLIAPPHPELTPQQKQHISERSSADIIGIGQSGQPPKRFGGSVAERVMIFERCPIVNSESKEAARGILVDKRSPLQSSAIGTVANNSAAPWKNIHQEGLGKVQVSRQFLTYIGTYSLTWAGKFSGIPAMKNHLFDHFIKTTSRKKFKKV